MAGLRFNEGKRKWGLLSWPSLAELAKVLEFGAKKYSSWNWSDGLSWSECFESMQRHATAWYCGEDKDPETGLSHMAHVLCNAMFLTHFIIFGTGKDDRPVALQQKEQDDGITDFTASVNALEQRRVPDVQTDVRPKDRIRIPIGYDHKGNALFGWQQSD